MDAESRKTVRDYLAALGEGGIASIFNDGREVHAIAAQGGKIPVFLTIGRMGTNGEVEAEAWQCPRLLCRDARYHPVEEDGSGAPARQGRGREGQRSEIRLPGPHQP